MEILQFALIALALFYIIIAIYSVIRLIKVARTDNAIKISIFFYGGMLIASTARGITLYLISENMIKPPETIEDKTLYIFIYLMVVMPDMINICVYLFLIWYFYANFILSHINLANDLRLFSKDDIPSINSKTYLMLYIMVPSYIAVFIIVCALTLGDVLGNETLYLINCYFDLITPVLFLAYYIFLLVKFSGRPYINPEMQSQVNRILIIVIIWSVARMVTGILGIGFASGNFFNSIIKDYINKNDNIYYSFTILVYFMVTEYIPNFFALDYSLMVTYIKERKPLLSEDDIEGSLGGYISNPSKTINTPRKVSNITEISAGKDKNDKEIRTSFGVIGVGNDKYNQPYRTSYTNANNNSLTNKTINDFIVKFSEMHLQDVLCQRKNGLGVIYKAQYMNKDACCRVIKFDRLSRYDLEGLSKDMEELTNIQNQFVCPITGLCVEKMPNIYILWPLYKSGSLYDLLHVQKVQLDIKARIEIARKVAIGMDYLQENMIYHYHLSSKNIYMSDDMTPKIADYGFHYLKDISSVFIKYKNKNSYTSPELLKENRIIGNTTSNSENFTQSDIYSFGILLWELYTLTIPFNISLSNVYTYVVINNYRPEITKDFDPNIAEVIRLCWETDPTKRPSFKKIIELLNK